MLARKALAGTAGAPKLYVENVFSCFLYTGNSSTQTITNNIDLSGEGGMVWFKDRKFANNHRIYDTVRGIQKYLDSSSTNAQGTNTNSGSDYGLTSFTSSGFSIGNDGYINDSSSNFASWTFRKAKKFFDVVTYTGNGSNRTISHNLGSVPGSIFIKRTDTTGAWAVYHRSLANTEYLVLNTSAAKATGTTYWNSTTPTSTEFSLGTATDVNANSGTYVAYLFAHDAGGFGLTGSDNVITCGSFNNSTRVELGYEPQWIMCKSTSGTGSYWWTQDSMRSMSLTNTCTVVANLSDAETNWGLSLLTPDATGFTPTGFGEGNPYIFIAIRRGPMKTPTSGTSVFTPDFSESSGAYTATAGFPIDLFIERGQTGSSNYWWTRQTGSNYLLSESTAAEASYTVNFDYMDKAVVPGVVGNYSTYINWCFRRAPGFFDEVCYTGNGGGLGTTVPHNLGVLPELIIVKARSGSGNWWVAHKDVFFNGILNLTDAWNTFAYNASISFSTATQLSTAFSGNTNGVTFVAYLFASVSGVSKVGSYTGNGSNQTINCGFTNGSRFVLIKATSTTGDWVVFDSARGIVSGSDPYLRLNSTAAEVTDKDAVDTDNTGFVVNETTGPNVNTNGVSYIYLAIS